MKLIRFLRPFVTTFLLIPIVIFVLISLISKYGYTQGNPPPMIPDFRTSPSPVPSEPPIVDIPTDQHLDDRCPRRYGRDFAGDGEMTQMIEAENITEATRIFNEELEDAAVECDRIRTGQDDRVHGFMFAGRIERVRDGSGEIRYIQPSTCCTPVPIECR